ncbi:hypothetical protein [Streptomyces yunnanensis]|uniref:Ribbon-helix-helix protein, copG family n=1 Tax=Streptomyces yunnanensis TaxID=156453 RepID=A0A9X8QS86_9ACTN|nr:hypothetical protein [Streptomyces yunnanensis]SHL74018.1 hypothetical protein SAMN05216268_10635 [Streptomyces yunnanensis]
MPNAPKTPTRPVRVDLDEWAEFGKAAAAMGTDRSAAIRAFMAWYIHKPGAKQVKRPDRDAWKAESSEAQGNAE